MKDNRKTRHIEAKRTVSRRMQSELLNTTKLIR